MKRNAHITALLILLFLLAGCTAEVEFCTVTFDTGSEEESIASQTVMKGKRAIEPRSPEKENMIFSHWTLNGEKYDFSTPVTEDITLIASYTPLYKIVFYTAGGEPVQNDIQYVKEGDYVIEPSAPEYDSKWGFREWVLVSDDDTTSSFDFKKTPVKSNLTFRATYWEKYSVTYLNADGSAYSTETVKEKDKAPLLEGPKRDGAWSFSGWLKDGVSYDFNSPVTENIILTPSYIEGYRITFDSDGGSYTPSEQFIKENGTVIEPRSPEKESSRGFMWWTDENGEPYDFSSPVTSSFTLKAQYWPANIISGGDSSSYDREMSSVKDEVLCFDYIMDKIVSSSALTEGSEDFSEVFGNGDENKETVSGILRAALIESGEVTIEETAYTLSEISGYTVITGGCSIEKNSSEISYKDTTAGVTRYTIDISGLKIKVKYWIEDGDRDKTEEESADISVRGTLIKISDGRYEEHIRLTVNGKEYPVLHAAGTKAGEGRVLFFVYKGLSTYIDET